MAPHPALTFCPYLALKKPLDFANWTIGPLAAFDDRWTDPAFKRQAHAFLAKFVTDVGKPIKTPGVLVRRGGQLDGQPPTLDEIEALGLALAFAFLDENPRNRGDGQVDGWSILTADNSEVYVWPIDVERGNVTLSAGLMVHKTSGGYTIADPQLVIRPRTELHMPLGPRHAETDLLEATYNVLLSSIQSPGRNPAADHLVATIRWFSKAWWNTERITYGERLVLLKTGFEALTETSNSRESAARLRALFESIPDTDATDAELLMWSPAETPIHSNTFKGKTELLTDLEHWFLKIFADARNTIIHQGIVPSLMYDQPGSQYAGPIVFTAEFLLRAAVKVSLHALGYPDLWRSPMYRASKGVYELLEQRNASDPEV